MKTRQQVQEDIAVLRQWAREIQAKGEQVPRELLMQLIRKNTELENAK